MFKLRIPFLHLCFFHHPAVVTVYAEFLSRFTTQSCQRKCIIIDIDGNVDKLGLIGTSLLDFQLYEYRIVVFSPVSTVVFLFYLAHGIHKSFLLYPEQLVYLETALGSFVTHKNLFVCSSGSHNEIEGRPAFTVGILYMLGIEDNVIVVEVALCAHSKIFSHNTLEARCRQLVNSEVNDVFSHRNQFFVGLSCFSGTCPGIALY